MTDFTPAGMVKRGEEGRKEKKEIEVEI